MPKSAPDVRETDVLLVSMPFGILVTPSLALGLLEASLAKLKLRVRQRYFSLLFTERLGYVEYQWIANRFGSGHEELGEWAFAATLFPDVDLHPEDYLRTIVHHPPRDLDHFFGGLPDEILQSVLKARDLADCFLDDCMREVEAMQPKVVAFTSMFQQRVASLALARRIKSWRPETVVVMGGADCESVRGKAIVQSFPYVDAAVSGPGDVVFPEIVMRALEGRSLSGIRGVYTAEESCDRGAPNAASPGMDDLPFPMFDDYFRDLEASGLKLPVLYLSLETSRGCWWGESHHCTFCSINGAGMAYSSKSAARVVAEVKHFTQRYPGVQLVMTDSILNVRHLKTAMPELVKSGLDLDMMYEVRVTLNEEQVQLLRACGVRTLQPGIESLSTEVLTLMRKHTSYLSNLRLLKLGRLYDIAMFWNILIGFPDEPPEAYAAMARLVPKVTHLEPPRKIRTIEIGRHSPLFEEADSLGVINLQPSPAYRYIYPFDEEVVRDLATYFTHEYRNPRDLPTYTYALTVETQRWWADQKHSSLTVTYEPDRSLIEEGRPAYGTHVIVLEGLEHYVHRACEDIRTTDALRIDLASMATRAEIDEALASLERRGLLVRDGNRALSLAVPKREVATDDDPVSSIKKKVYPSQLQTTALGLC